MDEWTTATPFLSYRREQWYFCYLFNMHINHTQCITERPLKLEYLINILQNNNWIIINPYSESNGCRFNPNFSPQEAGSVAITHRVKNRWPLYHNLMSIYKTHLQAVAQNPHRQRENICTHMPHLFSGFQPHTLLLQSDCAKWVTCQEMAFSNGLVGLL